MNSMASNLTVLLTGSLCLYLLISLITNFLQKYWFTPLRIQRVMNLQGIKGPSYKFIHGNNKETLKMMKEAESKPIATLSHDILPRVQPHIYSGLKSYGKCYLSWRGTIPELYITEPELVKELLKSNDGSGAFPKRTSRERKKIEEDFVFKLIGDGLVTAEGQKWAKQRKLANYAFHGESLKNMTPAMIASVETMLERWKQFEGKEIEVFQEFRLLTSEVISRTAFGSSYLEGEKIFDMLRKLAVLVNKSFFKTKLPPLISKFWKTADSIEADKLVKGIHNLVMKMVKKREEKVISGEANTFGTDFLGLLLKSFHDPDKNNRLSVQDLVDECKTFYLAGQETVNSALGWTVLLLAIHPEWQEKARKEVIEVFGNQNPHSEGIGKLKIMTMIIYETLRLYTPATNVVRRVENEVQIGKLILPADLHLIIQIRALHHDPDTWGDDVHLFKPERFAEGIAKATNFNAGTYLPFGLGPRSCVGMSFALTEIKTALSMILQRYTISLSPTYSHAPWLLVTLMPQHGIQVMLHPLLGHFLVHTTIRKPPHSNKTKVHPHIYSRIKSYGKCHLSWRGSTPELYIIEPEIVKELLKSNDGSGVFPKRTSRERKIKNEEDFVLKLLGDGLVTSQGEKWARQRKLANYAFHGESLKRMTPAVIASVETMLKRWRQFEGKEIEVFQEFRLLTSEVISRTAFGSSYLDGEKIFDMLKRLSALAGRNFFKTKLPPVISKFWKTADSIESNKLVKGIHDSIMEMVKKREEKVFSGEANNFGTDFLGLLVSSFHDPDKNNRLSVQDLVDECKTFYLGGQETVNNTLAWTVLLLAIHTEWQEKARKEVFEVFGNQNPHSEGIGKLKIMTMIINETLRLYPTANNIVRKVEDEAQLGKLILPADLYLIIPILALHHDPETWGDDVHHFKPERFAEGIAKATKFNAASYIPFGLGPRSCVGMSFAMTEIKTALSMILQRYSISLSLTYSHAPSVIVSLQPQHGIQKYWFTPLRIQRVMNLQGIKGPSYKFMHGNNKETLKMIKEAQSKPMATMSHDILPRVHPHIYSWLNLYGKCYLSWKGSMPELYITEPELVKELLKSNDGSGAFPKFTSRERKNNEEDIGLKLVGDSILTSQGQKWAKLRKLANYAFHGESLKSMTPAMIASVETMIEKWKQFEGKEIEVYQEFRLLTSEVISRTAFGSSYLEGEKIFDMLGKLAVLAKRNIFKTKLPPVISKFWKTGDTIESDKLVKGIHDSVMKMVKKREEKVFSGEANSFGTDFLGLLLKSFHDPDKNNRLSVQDLVDECKTFYLAGQDTVNSALAWTVLLLAIHTEWQEKARKEVIEVFGNQNPHSEGIGKLKIMTMIIYETLRLYTPVTTIARRVENEVQLGKLTLPADISLFVQITALHHDPKTWGDDVHVFKPERFAEGIAKATKFNAATYLPFGLGPRSCVGMSFAMTEIKIALSMILQRYTISLSPTYRHAPSLLVALQPQHGIQVTLHSLYN
ncbi:Cytochrome P450 [Corchorus capsularis]|uniref:Cytochrome P450 n=1 Tax=Corchorus capsularis TaxID=210143 RepID=A0A1R3JFH3_COCAP|nr:Cytochrome P450 [Corchorus capsularis]